MFSVKAEIVVQSGARLIYTSPWQRLGKPAPRPEDGYYGIASFLLLIFFFFSFRLLTVARGKEKRSWIHCRLFRAFLPLDLFGSEIVSGNLAKGVGPRYSGYSGVLASY